MPRKKKKLSLKTKRRLVRYFKWGLGATAFVGFFVSFLILARLPEITIAVVKVEGTYFSDDSLVHEVVEGKLKGSYAFLVPKKNAFAVPANGIEKELLSVFPSIQGVSITKDSLNTLRVSVSERIPVAKWCRDFSSTSPCYLMDKDGFIFTPEEGNNFLTYSGHIDTRPVGKTFLHGDFEALNNTVSNLEETTARTPTNVLVDEYDDVTVYFKEGGELKFVRSFDETILLNNVASVFASQRFDTDEELLYADFRFGNKVYVKFVENETEP